MCGDAVDACVFLDCGFKTAWRQASASARMHSDAGVSCAFLHALNRSLADRVEADGCCRFRRRKTRCAVASSSVGGNTSMIAPRIAHWPLAFHHGYALIAQPVSRAFDQFAGGDASVFPAGCTAACWNMPARSGSGPASLRPIRTAHCSFPLGGVGQHLQALPGAFAAGGGTAELHVAAGEYGGGLSRAGRYLAPAAWR